MSNFPEEFSAADIRALREHLDKSAIQNCIAMYFHALDSRDFSLLEQVYSPDASASFTTVEGVTASVSGREEITAAMRNVGAFRVSLHGPRNTRILVDGDVASADTFAVDALLIDDRDSSSLPAWQIPAPLLRFHGLRYVDQLARLPEGWRIKTRRHQELWRYHATGVLVSPELPH